MIKQGSKKPSAAEPASREGGPSDVTVELAVLEKVAWVMDHSLRVPGTGFRIGLDFLLGLVPGLGDVFSSFLHLVVIAFSAFRYRLPKAVVGRMVANALIDAGVGFVPLVGDVADAGFKAHSRNLDVLRSALEYRQAGQEVPTGSAKRYLFLLAAIMVLALVGLVALFAVFVVLLYRLFF